MQLLVPRLARGLDGCRGRDRRYVEISEVAPCLHSAIGGKFVLSFVDNSIKHHTMADSRKFCLEIVGLRYAQKQGRDVNSDTCLYPLLERS